MNKKCEECKYKIIVDEQECFFLGMHTESQLAPNEFEEYRALESGLNFYIEMEEYYLKNDLESHKDCFGCKNKFRAENSRKYFREMLAFVNKESGWTPELKLVIISYISEKYFDEFGSF